MKRETVFSPCRRYRYTLWREWGPRPLGFQFDPHPDYYPGRPDQYVQFVCLNPSTADERQDDPTVRRCVDYAKRWGFGALCVTNIFAWRDTDPEAMRKVPTPVSHGNVEVGTAESANGSITWVTDANDHHLVEVASKASLLVCAWGKHGEHLGRGKRVAEMFKKCRDPRWHFPRLHCLKVNKDGSPQHPLYLSADLLPIPFAL